ncbi:MAG: energy-coupling factor transporter transmembrane component T [Oscillospiraceae bacterium]
MISDITFGQYFPVNSAVHKADPRTKLLLLIAFIVFVFVSNNVFSLGIMLAFLLVLMAISKIPFKMYMKNLKTILPIIIFTSALNALYVNTGTPLFDWWIIHITTDGLLRALFMSLRIGMLILASAMLSYSTTPTDLTNGMENLLKPLNHLGLKSAIHTMAMTMTIALRFIPTLIEETGKIMNAQKARGADMESGGLIKRVKALLPILIPLLISSVRRAYDLAEAMECRCYNGGEGRTRFQIMKYKPVDLYALVLFILVCAGALTLNILF